MSRLEFKQKELEQNLKSDEAQEQYNAYKGEINEIYDEISNGVKIRSKCGGGTNLLSNLINSF